MRRRWRNENVEFVRDDPRFKLLAKEHGKAKAARIRIAEMAAEEAERPGEGELPLAEMLEVLPPDFHVGVEVPDLTALQKGVTPRAHAARVVNGARALGF